MASWCTLAIRRRMRMTPNGGTRRSWPGGGDGRLNARLARDTGVQLAVRIGIHTGLVVVGEMGGGSRQEQLALGETPTWPPASRGSPRLIRSRSVPPLSVSYEDTLRVRTWGHTCSRAWLRRWCIVSWGKCGAESPGGGGGQRLHALVPRVRSGAAARALGAEPGR